MELVQVTNDLGLALPPPFTDCVPDDEHERYIGEQDCFLDDHHMHFTRVMYDTHPDARVRQFGQHEFNRILMPRCRHVQWHEWVPNGIPIPRIEVIDAFLDEAQVLKELGIVTRKLVDIEVSLLGDSPKAIIRRFGRDESRYRESYQEFAEAGLELTTRVQTLEVVPEHVVSSVLARFEQRFESPLAA